MLPSKTWNMNIYNKNLVFIKKERLHKNNNIRVEKIILCTFLITIMSFVFYRE